MQAVTIQNGHVAYRDDLPEPVPGADEVLLEVTQAGICETDLQLARGYMGFSGILGHEFVAVAREGEFAGRRVVAEINCNCRHCPRCRQGLGNHCAERSVVGIDRHDGAFAQRVAIPQHNLHPVPDSVSDDQAVFVEPLAAALEINQQLHFSGDEHVLILGDGRLAFLCAQTLRLETSNVTVVGKHPAKMARFDSQGIETVHLDAVAGDHSFDVVVDCTGSETGLPLALTCVRPRGTVVMKTTVASGHQLSLAPLVIDEITVVGSRCGPFDRAIQALQDKSVDVSGLITHRYPLQAVAEAMLSAVDPDAFKVVFDIQNAE